MFRTRLLIFLAAAAGLALWWGAVALLRLVGCASCGQWPGVLKLGAIAVGCAACAFVAVVLFLRIFRAEVADREADHRKSRDKDAPPWAKR